MLLGGTAGPKRSAGSDADSMGRQSHNGAQLVAIAMSRLKSSSSVRFPFKEIADADFDFGILEDGGNTEFSTGGFDESG